MTPKEPVAFSLVLFMTKTTSVLSLGLIALDLKIDAPTATVMVAICVAASSMWQSWMLTKVHTLVNSNFTEAKAARAAAEASLKTSTDLNTHLQQQLDTRPAAIPVAVSFTKETP